MKVTATKRASLRMLILVIDVRFWTDVRGASVARESKIAAQVTRLFRADHLA
jgi:hypothetical protein